MKYCHCLFFLVLGFALFSCDKSLKNSTLKERGFRSNKDLDSSAYKVNVLNRNYQGEIVELNILDINGRKNFHLKTNHFFRIKTDSSFTIVEYADLLSPDSNFKYLEIVPVIHFSLNYQHKQLTLNREVVYPLPKQSESKQDSILQVFSSKSISYEEAYFNMQDLFICAMQNNSLCKSTFQNLPSIIEFDTDASFDVLYDSLNEGLNILTNR